MITDKHRVDQKVWLVSLRLHALRYLNKTRFLPGDRTSNCERWETPREYNVMFLESKCFSSPTEFNSFRIRGLQALRRISVGEEL